MKSELLEAIIEVCLLIPIRGWPGEANCVWGAPLLIWGEPGTGKSDRIGQIADRLSLHWSVVYCGQHPPEDFSGALIPDGKGGAKSICSIDAIREIMEFGEGLIVLDEVNQAAPVTQGAIMSLVQARRAGGHKIPGRVRIISAANPEEIAAGGHRLAPSLANRYLHVDDDKGPSMEEFVAYRARRKRKSDNNLEKNNILAMENLIARRWPDVLPKADGAFAGYLKSFPGQLHNRPKIEHENSGRAWPSLRTNELALLSYATCLALEQMLGKRQQLVINELFEAALGEGAAKNIISYFKNLDLPDPLDMLTKGWTIDNNRLDRTMAAYSSMVSYVTNRPDRAEQLKLAVSCWDMLGNLMKENQHDMLGPLVDSMVESKLGKNAKDPAIDTAAKKVYVELGLSGMSKYMVE